MSTIIKKQSAQLVNNMKKIIFTSRLDGDTSRGAYHLCKIAPQLSETYPDLQIIIIGGGTEYPRIAQISSKINLKLNRELIFALGTQSNPSNFYDENTLFVGVSRAALEAMSRGSPAILLGNEGYLGLLDESKLKRALQTNFTCRGNPICTPEELLCEINLYFSLPAPEQKHLSHLSKQTVKKHFSADQMARETLTFYRETIQFYSAKPQKITLCGYYGKGNLGDETIYLALKNAILKATSDRATIQILNTKNPIKIAKILLKTDLFVFGGGSLIQNSTSNASLFYYLAVIFAASVFAQNKIMLANGIGPIKGAVFHQKILERLTAHALNTFDFISVRDSTSREYLRNLIPHRKIHLVPDPALAIFENNSQKLNRQLIFSEESNYFLYIPCARGLKGAKITPAALRKTLKKLEQTHSCKALLCILNPPEDGALSEAIVDFESTFPTTPTELCEILRNARFTVSGRYHGSLFSAACGVPTLSVSDDPKLSALCKDFGLYKCPPTRALADEISLAHHTAKMLSHHQSNQKLILSQVEKSTTQTKAALKTIFTRYRNN